MWECLPYSLLLKVFQYLSSCEILRCGCACHSWNLAASDELLWKRKFYEDWKISTSIPLMPGKSSWRSEYRRLKYLTPIVQTEVLCEHMHQVLHVSFSHNGKAFASCSKDGYIKVWNAVYPATVKYGRDMKEFSWNYTQYSQFNESDTLLLVSGVHFGAHTASGEIAVFNLQDGFTLQCRVLNKPYDIFGTWYTDNYLLSGRLYFLGHMISCSALWLNKAWQESESEKKPIVKQLYKFYNKNASSIRTIIVANCLSEDGATGFDAEATPSCSVSKDNVSASGQAQVKGNPVSHKALSSPQWVVPSGWNRGNEFSQSNRRHLRDMEDMEAVIHEACTMDNPIWYSQEYRRVEMERRSAAHHRKGRPENYLDDDDEDRDSSSACSDLDDLNGQSDEDMSPVDYEEETNGASGISEGPGCRSDDDTDDMTDSVEEDASIETILDPREKLLIFTTGSLTYTPHQIGFKRIKPFTFVEKVHEMVSLSQRLAERRNQEASPDFHDESNMFDKVDHIIDLHGHIIGMGLSPDHRFLYVNSRPWPKDYVIEQPLTPPPIAQEIDIHVIDLVTLREVGTMLRAHKAYTPNDECFFIFLDVSNQYVASGAEDKHGYLWDRHYGNCLARLPHEDVVNSVAFNPRDPEMLVTASDDYTLKVWRSKNRASELGLL